MPQAPDIFDSAFMRQLQALEAALLRLKGRGGEGHVARGRAAGQNEFHGHRPYVAGDDLRRLDWNAYGRLGKLFLREFEPEKHEHITLVVDRSRSMAAGDKHVFARHVAAAFGYLTLNQGGSATLAGGATISGPSRFSRLLDALREAEPDQATGLGPALKAIAATPKPPADLVVVGDLLEPVEVLEPLQTLTRRGTNVTLVQVLSHDEADPAAGGNVELHGLEEGEALRLRLGDAVIAAYRAQLEGHLQAIGNLARHYGWTHVVAESGDDLRELFVRELLPAGAAP
ncbi:MAG: DUF58 domain-containing protein [Planctomycetes bacterium]|nr:DUF58 domain-containing protein [Planctomycetota bacterium]